PHRNAPGVAQRLGHGHPDAKPRVRPGADGDGDPVHIGRPEPQRLHKRLRRRQEVLRVPLWHSQHAGTEQPSLRNDGDAAEPPGGVKAQHGHVGRPPQAPPVLSKPSSEKARWSPLIRSRSISRAYTVMRRREPKTSKTTSKRRRGRAGSPLSPPPTAVTASSGSRYSSHPKASISASASSNR